MDIPSPQPVTRQVASPASLPQTVTFTQAQLEWLERQFPEPTYMVGTDESAFMVKAIQRGVVHEIRRRLAKAGGIG